MTVRGLVNGLSDRTFVDSFVKLRALKNTEKRGVKRYSLFTSRVKNGFVTVSPPGPMLVRAVSSPPT
jgi:hypothetical protein